VGQWAFGGLAIAS